MSKRISWENYFMNITKEVAERANCLQVKFAAVLVKDGRIISTGYNGAPRKTKDCMERGSCLRRELNIPSGHRYELCRSVHAEQNAIINAARSGVNLVGSDLYLFGYVPDKKGKKLVNSIPCFICKKMIINAGIKRVIGMMKDGKIKVFNVDQWVEDWKTADMTDDIDVYGK